MTSEEVYEVYISFSNGPVFELLGLWRQVRTWSYCNEL